MIRLLISDLDHTLLTYDGHQTFISESDLQAIRLLATNSVKLIVASGRDHGFILNCLNEYGVNTDVIGANGSTAVIDNKQIISHLIDNDAMKKAYDYVVNTYPHIYIKASSIDGQEYRYDTLIKTRYKDAYQPLSLAEFLAKEDISINRFVVSCDKEEEVIIAMHDLKERFGDYFEFNQSSKNLVDITPKGIDKGKTVAEIIDLLGYEKRQVASIGDSPNDISMFKKTGLSFAMANGHQDVIKNADHIVDSFAQAVEMILRKDV
jgi:Cof subfamily protein (haloacid dehalogenase superfamily)